MKKIFFVMFLVILLVGTISAGEISTWDNILNYKNNDLTVDIINTLGLEKLGTIELKSHSSVDEVLEFGFGKEEVVMYYDFTDWELYEDGLGEVYFTDMNTGEEIQKDYYFVEWKEIDIVINDYKETCELSLNGTNVCRSVLSGTHLEKRFEWVELTNKNIENKRIGIKTYVSDRDYIDAIWIIAGKKIKRHASWTASLNVGLYHYYNFDEPSGTVLIDSIGTTNGTTTGATVNVTGILGRAYDFEEGDNDWVEIESAQYPFVGSVSFWVKPETLIAASVILTALEDADDTSNRLEFRIEGTAGNVSITNAVGSATSQTEEALVNTTQWHHLVYTSDGTVAKSYVNGREINLIGTYTASFWFGNVTSIENYVFGQLKRDSQNILKYDGLIDEAGFWNRTLSQAEVTQLYNSGVGITYTDEFAPTITLNTPIDNANFSISNINFGGVISDAINPITNVSLIIDDTYIETNISGINNSNYTFTSTPTEGEHDWTYESCNDESLCTNATTRTFTIDYLVEEGIFYNTTSYETIGETFTINITTNGTQTTSAVFYYNDISQGASTKTGTDTNANFSNTIQIPTSIGEREFYWDITIGLNSEDSTKTNQTVNETIFNICNATYTTPFLNVSFKDETNDEVINATIPTSNFIYYLGDGTITKTYTFVNTSINYYYNFCATPNLTFHTDPYIQYKQGADYPQRIYDAEILDYTNDTTDLTLYLLGTADGIYVTFQVINTANLVLSGVEVTAVREISGSDVQVGIGTTGADGGVTLWLNPDFSHDFTFTKSGFDVLEASFPPTQSAYTITLGGGVTPTDSYLKGIISSILPVDSSLVNDTDYTFGFNLTSSFWDLTSYGFDLRLVNGTIITGSTTTTSGTPLTLIFNTLNQTKIYLDYYWLINETYTNGTSLWLVYNTLNTQWSISTFFTDLDTYLDSGFFGIDNFGRYLIIFIVIFFTVGIMSYKFGFTSPLNISVMTFLIVFFFDVVVGIIPPLSLFSGTEVNYLLTFLTGLIATIVILNEVKR